LIFESGVALFRYRLETELLGPTSRKDLAKQEAKGQFALSALEQIGATRNLNTQGRNWLDTVAKQSGRLVTLALAIGLRLFPFTATTSKRRKFGGEQRDVLGPQPTSRILNPGRCS
jgi:hypothetical protein